MKIGGTASTLQWALFLSGMVHAVTDLLAGSPMTLIEARWQVISPARSG
jgi:hypothetical protein